MSPTRHDQYQRCVSVTELAFVSGAQKAQNASEAGQRKGRKKMLKKVTANLVWKSSSQERANGSSRVELPSLTDPWNDLTYVYPDTLFDCNMLGNAGPAVHL